MFAEDTTHHSERAAPTVIWESALGGQTISKMSKSETVTFQTSNLPQISARPSHLSTFQLRASISAPLFLPLNAKNQKSTPDIQRSSAGHSAEPLSSRPITWHSADQSLTLRGPTYSATLSASPEVFQNTPHCFLTVWDIQNTFSTCPWNTMSLREALRHSAEQCFTPRDTVSLREP